MRVLLLSQYFWPESFRITSFVEALQREGADVTVLTAQHNYPGGVVFSGYSAASVRHERYGSIEILRVPIVPRGAGSAVGLIANYISFVVTASVFGPWLLRGRSFDIVLVYAPSPITQAIPAILLKWLKGAHVVTWVQDLWPEILKTTGFIRSRPVLSAVGTVVRWIYRHNDLLLGQSRAFVEAIGPMADSTPVEYFPNPGDSSSPYPTVDGPPALALPPGFNIVFAGNLGTLQALDVVLAAADMLRDEEDVRFVFVGSGSRSLWLADEVRRCRLTNVMITGRFEPAAMPGIIAQASALLVSLQRSEILSQTVPAKLQGYLASGRPILGSLDGEGAGLIEAAGAGFSSPAEDPAALAENIRKLARLDEAERLRMGVSGRTYYDRHFRPDFLAAQLLERFRRLRT